MVSRFFRYLEKVFDFGASLRSLSDGRVRPRCSTASVWVSAFLMFATRRGSLNGIEQDLRVPKRLEGLLGALKPSADTIGRVFGLMDPQPLRATLSAIHHRLGRNKVLVTDWPLRFAAVDGHEFFSLTVSSLSGVLPTDGNGQRSRRHRVLPSGGGLPPDRF
jgi:hypothetical protein